LRAKAFFAGHAKQIIPEIISRITLDAKRDKGRKRPFSPLALSAPRVVIVMDVA
jgi:hypothetical protein